MLLAVSNLLLCADLALEVVGQLAEPLAEIAINATKGLVENVSGRIGGRAQGRLAVLIAARMGPISNPNARAGAGARTSPMKKLTASRRASANREERRDMLSHSPKAERLRGIPQ
jgi:hypothetical protein